MKKITFLLLTILSFFSGYSQFPENFETSTAPSGFPAGWLVTDNGVGTSISWNIVNNPALLINGTNSAFINREFIGQGNTSEDWLISPVTAVPANGQLRFFTRQSLAGDNGTIYQIRTSTGTSQSALASYTILQQWTESELNQVFDQPEEKVVDLPTVPAGTNLYIAFVRVYMQTGGTLGGDRWVIDDVNVVQKCLNPTNLGAPTIAATSATLSWNGSTGAVGYEMEVLLATQTATGVATDISTTASFPKGGLTQNTNYKYYVRSNCGNGNYSVWVGPFNFQTLSIGTACSDPILIPSLPYQDLNNTGVFGNTLAGPQNSTCISGSVNYQSGNDVFYSYTATENCTVSFTLNPTEARSSMFIYSSCAGITGTCLAAIGNTTSNPRVLNLAVTAGSTYIILISSSLPTQTVGYNLIIQCENCATKPTNLAVSNPTLTGADFTWAAPTPAPISYQVAVQPQGSTIPTGAGQYTGITTPNFTPTDLASGTLYQYWVRSECAPGVFSAWVGPILFNTQICAPADKCTYIFRMTDTANNGWNNARMQIRQNGIVLETIGANYNSGAGPVDVAVALCPGIPFDIFWTVPGLQPQQCVVSVINSFGQTIATVLGAEQTVGTTIYTNTVNCTTPVCTIPPTNVTVSSISTTGGVINWTAPGLGAYLFDIYIVPSAGATAPVATTVPTYSSVVGFSFPTTIPLLADTFYDVYVRVQCNAPTNSVWSAVSKFKTLPTCPKPIAQTVTGITTTTATLGWTPGASETQWEVLLLAAPNAIEPAIPGITPTVGTGDFYIPNITGTAGVVQTLSATTSPALPALSASTIYYYYVRAVCQPGDDKSTWTGPFIFNTVTCEPADKCTYKFILTNTTNNSWNSGRMQVRQNGIVVATLGTGGINNANGISVAICNNAPFDLFWSVAGTLPEGIGVTVVDVNNDIVFTKLPGTETPLTVLYEDTILGNCAPPTCPKPTNLLVTSTAQTTATLSWTEVGSAIQWEVYVVAEGGTPPVNGSPLNGNTFPYYLAGTNTNFIVDNLQPSTRYQYYVRSICSTTDISTWTLLTPKSFITIPVNDECAASISVPINTSQICTLTVAGNTLGGTASAEISTCPGSENDDVWFHFVATSNIHIVNLLNIVGTTTNLRFAIYAGADCTTINQIFCSATNNNTAVLTNLNIGSTYKIRVYTNGNNINQSATFDVCVSTPPAPGTNDECINAIPITVNVLSECAYVTPGNLIGATGSTGVSNTCVGVEDDDVWFSFVATSANNVVSLLNIEGTTTNLNHAVYSGTCGALTQLYCSVANTVTTTNLNYVIGQTYYVRVWSNASNNEVVTFNICVKPISSCGNAAPFCGGDPQAPYIFPNTSGLGTGSSIGQVACLGSTPNPTYYTLHVGQTGPMNFTMLQNTLFNSAGQPIGQNLDVDFVAWGPFTSTDSCNEILFSDCPTCPNNTNNPNFYPFGNIIDCSFDASFTETISIPNAQAGEYYIILITNYNGGAGFISLVQTNFDVPNAGATICCDVNLGPDIEVCSTSTTLDALAGLANIENVPVIFEWYFNGVLIPGANQATITVTESGTYTVKGNCGLNPVEDSILVTMSPAISVTSPADYILCDTTPIDGFTNFDLNTLTSQVLGTLSNTDYNVTYYILEADAIADAASSIDLLVPFTNTIAYNQTIYIRVESNALSTCFAVVPVNLKVEVLGNAAFEYATTAFCKEDLPNPQPTYINGGIAGIFTANPSTGIVINELTGEIDLANSAVGPYEITNTITDLGVCGDATYKFNIVIGEAPKYTLSGDMEICPNENTIITVTPTAENNFNVNLVSYEWTFNATIIPTATTNSLAILGQGGYGTYAVTVNNNGCTSSQTFVVDPSTVVWNVTFGGSTSLCPAETGSLTAGVTNNTNNSVVTYTFTMPDGSEVVSTNNVLAINQTGVYTVVADILGCKSAPVSYTVDPSIANWQVSFVGEPYEICTGESTTLSFTAVNFNIDDANATYTWTSPSGVTGTGKTFTASQVGTYTLSVNILGCISTFNVPVIENALAIDVDFAQGCENNAYRLVADPVNGSFDVATSSFVWSGPQLVLTDQANAIIVKANGDYTVTVTNAQGCSSSKTVTINNTSCTIQKGISPNNDGDNDVFDLSALNVKKLFIYNRYGTAVYEFENYTNQWGGQSNTGSELPDGTYFYMVHTVAGENISGWIFINR